MGGGRRARPRPPKRGPRKKSRSRPKRKKSTKKPRKSKKDKKAKSAKGKKEKSSKKKSQKEGKGKSDKKKKKGPKDGDGDGDDSGEDADNGGSAPEPTSSNAEPRTTPPPNAPQMPFPGATPAVVTPEMMEMRERRRQGRCRSDEINAKITVEQLKDENGQPRFSSGRFGAVFLLPESCNLQKVQPVKEKDDVQSQSD